MEQFKLNSKSYIIIYNHDKGVIKTLQTCRLCLTMNPHWKSSTP